MSSLIGRFQRDLPFLRQGLVPQEEGGLEVDKLKYTGEEHEKLTDEDVKNLAEALMENNQFRGELKLNSNDLTDLAALYLAPIFEKQNGHNITKLKVDGNNFTSKAGEYIGSALSSNPEYKIKKLSFQGICLESIGLVRLMEAVNANANIKFLTIGVLTDDGLVQLAELLRENNSLEEISIQETKDPQKLWTERGRGAFTEVLESCTSLKQVILHFTREDEEADKAFKSEIKFYTKMKAKAEGKKKAYAKVLHSCEPTQMFDKLQELIESNDGAVHQMPVRKFYNNTFNTLLNRAMFALKKK